MGEVANNRPLELLSSINTPDDLRELTIEQLPEVCTEIRQFLIDTLSANPGHFASSMGAVDVTVALHYVFNTPYDRIVWDVGHQAYAHKILTGRRDRFYTNRTLNGLSGFPNPDESEYDTFAAGHASNSISAALGFAIASKLKNESPRRNIVAVIGDAAISGGLAFEGLNNAASTPNNLLIILNDNDMSIDKPVGALNTYLARLTSSPGYNNLRYKLYRIAKKMHLVSESGRGRLMRLNNSIKSAVAGEQNIFEGLNIRYFGPFDGNDVCQLVKTLSRIKNMDGPRILHLRTVKGKGYTPAEKDPANWHAPGKFNPETGKRQTGSGSPVTKFQNVFGETLLDLARKNPNVIAITAAMSSGTSVNIMQHELPQRVFDVGICEEHAVTFAAGLAKDGLRPVVAIYSSFLQRAFDQIVNDVALLRLPVIFAIDRAGLVGEDGATHHGLLDLAYMSSVPGMTVSAPSDEAMLRDLMITALAHTSGPFSIRYPRGTGDSLNWRETPPKALSIGKGIKVMASKDNSPQATILSIGTILTETRAAARRLSAEGIGVDLYDMIFLKPIDTGILDQVGQQGHQIFTVEDASIIGGLGDTVAAYMTHNYPGVKVTKIGVRDQFVTQGTVSQLKHICGLDAESIYQTISNNLKS